MTILNAFFATIRRPLLPITVSADWGVSSGLSPLTSATRILTVPAGNSGSIGITVNSLTGTLYYDLNLGGFVDISSGGSFTVASSDTLRFQLVGISGNAVDLDVVDNTTSMIIGGWNASID